MSWIKGEVAVQGCELCCRCQYHCDHRGNTYIYTAPMVWQHAPGTCGGIKHERTGSRMPLCKVCSIEQIQFSQTTGSFDLNFKLKVCSIEQLQIPQRTGSVDYKVCSIEQLQIPQRTGSVDSKVCSIEQLQIPQTMGSVDSKACSIEQLQIPETTGSVDSKYAALSRLRFCR